MISSSDALWYGLFTDANLPGTLEKQIEHPHVTFGYKVPVPHDVPWNTMFEVTAIGYANDGLNEAYLVELPAECEQWYFGADSPHITLSVSPESSPAQSAFLEFEPIQRIFTIPMYFGYYAKGRYFSE